MNLIRNVLPILLLFAGLAASAQQSKEELQRKTEQLKKEIEDAKREIATTNEGKKSIIVQLRVIEKNIERRNAVIRNIKGEVYYVEKDIIRTYRDIDTLKNELALLKEQYAQSVIYAYKNRSNYDFLNFLFSASHFGDVMRRISYLKTYRSFRQQKASDIARTQELMKAKIASLTGKRQEKTAALEEQGKQMAELAGEKKEKDKVVAELNSRQKELKASLATKEKERQKVQAAIAAVIKREIAEAQRKADEAARKKAAEDAAAKKAGTTTTPAPNSGNVARTTAPASDANLPKPVEKKPRQASQLETTPEGVIVSEEFEKNRGSLPWPVDKGQISLHYGINKVGPISIPSDGISIETSIGAPVKAIFDGEVVSVNNLGQTQLVILKHGKYFTTYSNLQGASVSRGQKISRGQVLGQAAANDQGIGQIDLQVDTEKGTINPEAWIKSR